MYKHWKKFLLGLSALFWSGCGDDSSSTKPAMSKEPVACELDHMWSPDDPSCTNPYSCMDTYNCEDKVICYKQHEEKKVTFDCHDEQGNKTIYTEDEFNSKYYVKDELIH